jgi:hypothetical protein
MIVSNPCSKSVTQRPELGREDNAGPRDATRDRSARPAHELGAMPAGGYHRPAFAPHRSWPVGAEKLAKSVASPGKSTLQRGRFLMLRGFSSAQEA